MAAALLRSALDLRAGLLRKLPRSGCAVTWLSILGVVLLVLTGSLLQHSLGSSCYPTGPSHRAPAGPADQAPVFDSRECNGWMGDVAAANVKLRLQRQLHGYQTALRTAAANLTAIVNGSGADGEGGPASVTEAAVARLQAGFLNPFLAEAVEQDARAAAAGKVRSLDPMFEVPAAANEARATFPRTACGAALAVPKVALMFLTVGGLPHWQLWTRWLEEAAGLAPIHHIATQHGCSPGAVATLQHICRQHAAAVQSAYKPQLLYSVYVHSPPYYNEAKSAAYRPGSAFHGRVIRCRVETQWATHDLVDAVRRLIREALKDPLNQRFLLISESDVPLYPPLLVWRQLMAEQESRVKCCKQDPPENLVSASPWMFGPFLRPEHWRKSSQWFVLLRPHAELYLNDTVVDANFRRFCYVGNDPFLARGRRCISDEHYLATLLAAHNQQQLCDCRHQLEGRHDTTGSPTFTLWQANHAHPVSFTADRVSEKLIQDMRHTRGCVEYAAAAMATHYDGFVQPGNWTQQQCETAAAEQEQRLAGGPPLDGQEVMGKYQAMPSGQCPLMGRKFKSGAAAAVWKLANNCSSSLRLLGESACSEEALARQKTWWRWV